MRILLTNDDGIHAPSIAALHQGDEVVRAIDWRALDT